MRQPTRTDVHSALWALLALPASDEADPAALEELFEDLHADLLRAREDLEDDTYEDLFIAVG